MHVLNREPSVPPPRPEAYLPSMSEGMDALGVPRDYFKLVRVQSGFPRMPLQRLLCEFL